MEESSENKSTTSPPSVADYDIIEKVKPFAGDSAVEWIDYTVQQAVIAQKTVVETLESTISITKSRLDQIKSTSTDHFHMTIETLRNLKSDYHVYEDIVFGKIKEGVYFTASHPFATSGLVIGSGILALKSTRRSLYYNTMRLFINDEAMLAKANAKVQKLRESVRTLTEEGKKLEKFSSDAEVELKRGRTKLRQAGKQIQGVISSAYKIERQAGGLKDILKELPNRDASGFRSEVSQLASEAKQERRILNKEVKKISNYGISV
ncbi:RGS1-HXK1-interacting protein 1 [Rutidosis leptorrhynchoides]|uniref:RGS1-HXK1-interacting protein 1 n=1 Tax=Rutidosis leptorrhynchoides TaxID=125765 RepID=UPI003A99755A